MATIKKFEDLECWQLARELDKKLIPLTKIGEFAKDFKLRDQILGSSGSVMDNISEGFERNGNKEFFQFLSIAKGSCGELRSQLYRAMDRNYISKDAFERLYQDAEVVAKKISGLMNYLTESELKGSKYKQHN